jgi:hypothetical protein
MMGAHNWHAMSYSPKTGLCADNRASVDITNCAIDLDKGDAELATTWTDPGFDAATPALYYVRVLENPVCRWSTYDALRMRRRACAACSGDNQGTCLDVTDLVPPLGCAPNE